MNNLIPKPFPATMVETIGATPGIHRLIHAVKLLSPPVIEIFLGIWVAAHSMRTFTRLDKDHHT